MATNGSSAVDAATLAAISRTDVVQRQERARVRQKNFAQIRNEMNSELKQLVVKNEQIKERQKLMPVVCQLAISHPRVLPGEKRQLTKVGEFVIENLDNEARELERDIAALKRALSLN